MFFPGDSVPRTPWQGRDALASPYFCICCCDRYRNTGGLGAAAPRRHSISTFLTMKPRAVYSGTGLCYGVFLKRDPGWSGLDARAIPIVLGPIGLTAAGATAKTGTRRPLAMLLCAKQAYSNSRLKMLEFEYSGCVSSRSKPQVSQGARRLSQ